MGATRVRITFQIPERVPAIAARSVAVRARGRSRDCFLPPVERLRHSPPGVAGEQGGQFVEPHVKLADPMALKRFDQLIRRLV